MTKKDRLANYSEQNFYNTMMNAYSKVRYKYVDQEPCDEDIEIIFNDL